MQEIQKWAWALLAQSLLGPLTSPSLLPLPHGLSSGLKYTKAFSVWSEAEIWLNVIMPVYSRMCASVHSCPSLPIACGISLWPNNLSPGFFPNPLPFHFWFVSAYRQLSVTHKMKLCIIANTSAVFSMGPGSILSASCILALIILKISFWARYY